MTQCPTTCVFTAQAITGPNRHASASFCVVSLLLLVQANRAETPAEVQTAFQQLPTVLRQMGVNSLCVDGFGVTVDITTNLLYFFNHKRGTVSNSSNGTSMNHTYASGDQCRCCGAEADDVIATLATHYTHVDPFTSISIFSADKECGPHRTVCCWLLQWYWHVKKTGSFSAQRYCLLTVCRTTISCCSRMCV
jgi:hypothetical protein